MTYKPLPPALKKKFVDALRSGEYRKLEGTMYSNDMNEYCAMGVLGRVLGIDHERLEGEGSLIGYAPTNLTEVVASFESRIVAMNDGEIFVEQLGDDDDGYETDDGDDQAHDFNTIADWVDDNL